MIDPTVADDRHGRSSRPWSPRAPASNAATGEPDLGQDRDHRRTTATPGSAAPPRTITACVWVGHADSVTADGDRVRAARPWTAAPIPALIFADIVNAYEELEAARRGRATSRRATADGARRRRRPTPATPRRRRPAPAEPAPAPSAPAPASSRAAEPRRPDAPAAAGGGGASGGSRRRRRRPASAVRRASAAAARGTRCRRRRSARAARPPA